MASYIATATSGLTIRFRVVRLTDGQIWNVAAGAFEAYNTANWTTTKYMVATTEQGASGTYVGTFPSGVTANTLVRIYAHPDVSGAPTPNLAVWFDDAWWDGTNLHIGAANVVAFGGVATASAQVALDGLVVTAGNTNLALATSVSAVLSRLGAPAGASVSADIAAVGTNASTAATQSTTAATQATSANANAASAAASAGTAALNSALIKAKTDNLPASPAAVGSAMTLANGAVTSSALATSGKDAIADAVWDEAMSGHTTSATFGWVMGDIRNIVQAQD